MPPRCAASSRTRWKIRGRLQAAIEAAFIMRSLERIGDHARNIARHVGFIGGDFDPQATGVLSSDKGISLSKP